MSSNVRTIYPIGSEGVDFQRLEAALDGGSFVGAAMYDGGDKNSGTLVTSPATPLASGRTLKIEGKTTAGVATTWKQAKRAQTNFATALAGQTRTDMLAPLGDLIALAAGAGIVVPDMNTVPVFGGFLGWPAGMDAFSIVSKSLSFRKGGTGALTEQGYFSGTQVMTNYGIFVTPTLPQYADFDLVSHYGPFFGANVGLILRPIQFWGQNALAGIVDYDYGFFVFFDELGDFASSTLSVSYAVGSGPIRCLQAGVTIEGSDLVDGVPTTVLEGAVGINTDILLREGVRTSRNHILLLDGKSTEETKIKRIKFQRSMVAVVGGHFLDPLAGLQYDSPGAIGPLQVEDCEFDKVREAMEVSIGNQLTYRGDTTYGFEHVPHGTSKVKGCTFRDIAYIMSWIGSELEVENCRRLAPDAYDNVPAWTPSYQVLVGAVSFDGVYDPNLKVCRNVSIEENSFSAKKENGSYGTLLQSPASALGADYSGAVLGGIVYLEAEGPGLTEKITVCNNEIEGFTFLETGALNVMPGFGAEIKDATFDENEISETAGPVFFAIPTALHWGDFDFTGNYHDIMVSGNKLENLRNQNLLIPGPPLALGAMTQKPTMWVQGSPTGFGSGGKVSFIKNNYKQSGRIPFTELGNNIATSLIYLDEFTSGCLVQEKNGLPDRQGVLAYVTDLGIDNRVVNHPNNKNKTPAGAAEKLKSFRAGVPHKRHHKHPDMKTGKITLPHS